MELLLFLAFFFLAVFIVGRLVEKIRIPWIFSALLIGLLLAIYNPFSDATNGDSFVFMANLGMLFLLFIIGFELNLKEILSQGSFIFTSTFFIILSETIVGTLLIHYLFNASWLISALVGTSFATVGESILLPILDEFKLVKTRLGQTILGIGVLDDLVEVLTIIVASVIIGRTAGYAHLSIWSNLLILAGLFALAFVFIKFHKAIRSIEFKDKDSMFLFVLFFLFFFVGIGMFVESSALGALLAGISLRNILPKTNLAFIGSRIRTVAYGFFAPIFFLWVGLNTQISYLISSFYLVLVIVAGAAAAKIFSSMVIFRKKFGVRDSVVIGVGLTVKMSTSIVIIKLLHDMGLIGDSLYSVLVASTIVFTLLVPILLPVLIKLRPGPVNS